MRSTRRASEPLLYVLATFWLYTEQEEEYIFILPKLIQNIDTLQAPNEVYLRYD